MAGPDDDPAKVGMVAAIYVAVEGGSECDLFSCGEGQVNRHV